MRTTGLAFLILALNAPPMAHAQQGFSAPGSITYPVNDQVFEVVGNSGRGFILYWCGAAHYARRVKGAHWRDKITIVRGLGRSQVTGRRSAVQYTLEPGALGITPQSNPSPNAYAVGDSKTVTEANGFCHELVFPWFF